MVAGSVRCTAARPQSLGQALAQRRVHFVGCPAAGGMILMPPALPAVPAPGTFDAMDEEFS